MQIESVAVLSFCVAGNHNSDSSAGVSWAEKVLNPFIPEFSVVRLSS